MAPEIHMTGPMCLIENTNGELVANPEALKILSAITQPVVVVAIVGLYRTGKSYLMNKLAGKNKGFSLGSTVKSHTKGIWMWCVPHPKKPEHTLVLLDTEGLGDVKKGDNQNDSWIFTLAVLLSSTLVYNSMGTINQQAMDQLYYVTELTHRIRSKSSPDENENEDSADFVSFFPDFVWTLRDFSLDLEADGQPLTPDEYLEYSLKLTQGLESLVLTYINAISRGDLPCMENAVLALAQIENSAAVQKAIAHYDQQMGQKVQLPAETLQELLDLHRVSEREATEVYMKNSFKDVDHLFQKKLAAQLDKKRDDFCKQNQEASSDRCSALLQVIFSPLEEEVKAGIYSKPGGYCLFIQKLQDLEKKYYEEPRKGIQAEEILQTYLKSKESVTDAILQTDQILTEKEKEIEVECVKAESAQASAKMVEEMQIKYQQMMEEKEKSYQEHVKQLTEKMERERAQLLEEQEKTLTSKLQEQARVLKERCQGESTQLQNEIQKLQKTLKKKTKRYMSHKLKI
ncbi:guanylate-binding protein 3 isoform 6 [Homo sapiens]|uniref:guanylate-binding protein 3 isoform 6 n=1 Tax=Homo sapiens TaxID=9606 RepID=UPI0005CFFBC3|nr:guanylate-binding protein 3 isoform X3 [Homo sapiens]XP_054191941.1 guanylate-binding protein 3 isoform X3 [Homo sapiens]|eukprot:XP_011539536.1 guanylate-binding protein 3 isoform X3 [Homo sapiens]